MVRLLSWHRVQSEERLGAALRRARVALQLLREELRAEHPCAPGGPGRAAWGYPEENEEQAQIV